MQIAGTKLKRTRSRDLDAASAAPLTADELRELDAYWRASDYLSVGQ